MPLSPNRLIGIIRIDSISDRLAPLDDEESLGSTLLAIACAKAHPPIASGVGQANGNSRQAVAGLVFCGAESHRVYADLPRLTADLGEALDCITARIRTATPTG